MSKRTTDRESLINRALLEMLAIPGTDPLKAVSEISAETDEYDGYVSNLSQVAWRRLLNDIQKRYNEHRPRGRRVPPRTPEQEKSAQEGIPQRRRAVDVKRSLVKGNVRCAACDGQYGTLQRLRKDHPERGFTKGQYLHRNGCQKELLREAQRLSYAVLQEAATNAPKLPRQR